jgi:hypothetical protein
VNGLLATKNWHSNFTTVDIQCTDAGWDGLQAEHEGRAPQEGVDWPLVVRTAAQTAQQLGACRLSRFAWTKLRTVPFPPDWRVRCEPNAMTINWMHTRHQARGPLGAAPSCFAACHPC